MEVTCEDAPVWQPRERTQWQKSVPAWVVNKPHHRWATDKTTHQSIQKWILVQSKVRSAKFCVAKKAPDMASVTISNSSGTRHRGTSSLSDIQKIMQAWITGIPIAYILNCHSSTATLSLSDQLTYCLGTTDSTPPVICIIYWADMYVLLIETFERLYNGGQYNLNWSWQSPLAHWEVSSHGTYQLSKTLSNNYRKYTFGEP